MRADTVGLREANVLPSVIRTIALAWASGTGLLSTVARVSCHVPDSRP